jgi:hypothetical protein
MKNILGLVLLSVLLSFSGCSTKTINQVKKIEKIEKVDKVDKVGALEKAFNDCEAKRDGIYFNGSIEELNKCTLITSKYERYKLEKTKTNQIVDVSDPQRLKDILIDTAKENDLTRYVYDNVQIQEGMINGEAHNSHDYWSMDKLAQIKKLKQLIVRGIRVTLNDQVPVDCDDTMIHNYMSAFDKGYPADQEYFSFAMVPPGGSLTGVVGKKMGGHAVNIVDVINDIPWVMEDRNHPVTLKRTLDRNHYYYVLTKRMDEDPRTSWDFIDKDGYNLLMSGEITLEEAFNRPAYRAFIEYSNTIFQRIEE